MSLLSTSVPAPAAPRSRRRSALGWAALAVAVVVAGLITVALQYDRSDTDPLAADSPRYDGARAIVTLLEEDGVAVEPARGSDEAEDALTSDATLVVTDTRGIAPDRLARLAENARHTVLLDTDYAGADAFFPGLGYGGYGADAVAPSCSLPAAEAAGDIVPGTGYALPDMTGVTACYPTGDGYALLRTTIAPGFDVTVLDATAILANDVLADGGNAALALALLGEADRVVWYTPSAVDAAGQAPPTLTELAPAWLTPAIALALLATLAAALWRGRRFGPLVAETLPVTVRANETLEGRARLYRAAQDPAHAADALRAGALTRIRRRLSLPVSAGVQEVAESAAALLGSDPRSVYAILTEVPRDDASLVDTATRLGALEDDLASTDLWEGHPS